MSFVEVELSEAEWVCSTGGGFSKRTWCVAAPYVPHLAGRPRDPMSEEFWLSMQALSEAPPPGFATSLTPARWARHAPSIPPGCVWRRLFTVTVPVGHRLRQCVSHPDRAKAAREETLRRMPRRLAHTLYTVQPNGLLASDQVIAARARAKTRCVEAPAPLDVAIVHVNAALAALGSLT